MNSPQIHNSGDRSHRTELATESRGAFLVKRIALVTVLAGCAFVAFATRVDTPLDESSPAFAVTLDTPAQSAKDQAEARLATSVTEYYFPALYANQARSNDGNVMTYEHD